MIDQKTFDDLLELVGSEFINELLDTFFETGPQLVEELKSSLLAEDKDTFRRAAHSLKSNCASFGALELAAQARELEMLGRDGLLDQVGSKITDLETNYWLTVEELKRMAGG